MTALCNYSEKVFIIKIAPPSHGIHSYWLSAQGEQVDASVSSIKSQTVHRTIDTSLLITFSILRICFTKSKH